MMTAYDGLMVKLEKISNSYDDVKKFWFKNQAEDLVNVAKYLHDIDVLTSDEFDYIDCKAFSILIRFEHYIY